MSMVNTPVWGVFLWLILVWAWVIWLLPSVNWKAGCTPFLYLYTP